MIIFSRLIWRKMYLKPTLNLRVYWWLTRLISYPYNVASIFANPTKLEKITKVAISLSVFNAELWIEETICSIQQQTMQNWLLIIHDDGSSDNSPEIIKSLIAGDSRFQYIPNETNKGPYANHNSARKIALNNRSTTHFAVIDHDDIAHPNWLTRCVYIAKKSKSLGVRPINIRVDQDNKKPLFSYPAVNQTLWDIEAIQKLGGYNLETGIPDSDFMKRAERLSFIQNTSILLSLSCNHRMRVHAKNVSSSYTKKMKLELAEKSYSNSSDSELFFPL